MLSLRQGPLKERYSKEFERISKLDPDTLDNDFLDEFTNFEDTQLNDERSE